MLSLEGTQLGNYDVMRRIRVGGMGAVYEGRQRTAFGRRVAIKVILGDFATDRDMRRRFAREARTIAGLHHPHILPLIEFGDEQGILYLVMPFIDGGTLTSYLRHHLPDLGEVMALYQQLLDAVEYAHEHNLIHRDIKSSNVLLEMRRNAAPYVYLADFGLVRTMRQNDSSQVGKPIPLEQVPGTPHYMAPEQTRGIVTPLTDIYALGVLLYQILTGNLPYNDPDEVRVIKMHLYDPIPSPCDYDGSIPQELGEVVRIAMAKNPADRYQSVVQLRQAFLSALAEPDIMSAVNDSEEEMPPIESVDAAPVDLEILPSAELRNQQVPLTIKLPPSDLYVPAEAVPRRPLPGPNQPNQRRPSDPLEVDAAGRKRLTKALKRAVEYPGAEAPRPIIMQQRPRITDDRPMERERLPERDRPLNPVAPLNAAPTTIIREQRDHNDRSDRQERIETSEHNGRNERGNRVYATSDTFRRPRNTDDPFPPVKRRQRRPILSALVVVVVLTLIVILVASRLFGMELFPTGVPIIGASPVATVRISVKQQTLQNTFLLTASPQFSSPDLTTHSIPDRVVQESAQGSSTVATTGNNTSKGTSAHGMIEFLNHTANPVQVRQGLVLNGPVGIQVLITQSITVQPKQGDQFGKADALAITIQPGQAGNIAINQVSGTCCNAALFIRNPAPFTGGTDPRSSHFVAQSDIDNAQKALVTKLEQQISPQLQQQVGAGESMVGAPDYQITTSADNPVNAQTDTVTVSAKVSGSATLYKKDVAVQTAMVLLNQQAGNNYQLQGRQTVASFDAESGKNNIAYLKVSVSGTWAYDFTDSQAQNLRDPIRGATRDVALAYLKAQPGVASADIHLPLGTDHLPDAVGNIEVMLERSN